MTKYNAINPRLGLFIVSVLLIIHIILFKIWTTGFVVDNNSCFDVLSWLTILFSIAIIFYLKKLTGTLFSIVVMFVLLYILFMFGQVILFAIGALNDEFLSGKFTISECIDGILDAQLFLALFLIGVTCVKYPNTTKSRLYLNNHGVKIGYWIIFISLPFELFVSISKIVISVTLGYAALYQDIAYDLIPSSFKIMSYFFLPGIWYLYFCSKPKSTDEKISIALLIWVCVSYLLMGYRANAMIPVLLYLYASRIKNRKSSGIKFNNIRQKIVLSTLIAILVIFIFPAVRLSRNSGGIESISISEMIKDNEMFATINDMGKSLQTLIYTKKVVPDIEEYRYGESYAIATTIAFPNLFWDKHPAETYGSLGRWITGVVDPDFYNMGGALGYSCSAEAYVNFGIGGIIFIAFIFGLIIMKVEKITLSYNSPIGYASYAIIGFYLLFYPRGELGELVRGIAWYMFIPLIIYTVTKKIKSPFIYAAKI